MATRSEIEAVMPDAAAEVFREIGVYPHGLGLAGKDGELALSVTLHKPSEKADYPSSILGIPTVFRVVAPPVFLNRRRHAGGG